ncbi:MAG TPA: DJ-1/PfpI family protein [Thermoanaerobaculia bacterium]|nr:DJ-1/PfpI family protein [Thermoanaerobaculia bacterium]
MSTALLHPRFGAAAPATGGEGKAYICPPCGLPCDKRTFDKPGACPNCGMTLIPAAGAEGSPPRVAILLFNGAQLIDFAGPWEVFGTAGFLVHTVAERQETLTAVFGEKVVPDFTFDHSPKADVLLIPGGGVWDEAIHSAPLLAWIQAKAEEATFVVSVCTGAFLLQKAGLLNGHTVTTTYGMIDDLRGPDTQVVYDKRFVESGKVITTAGLSAGIDGALHVVSRLLGEGAAQSAALEMEYDWDPAGNYARAALADRFLPDGLAFAKPNVKGAKATMVSTAGDRDHWKTKILVSEPRSRAEVLEVMRNRITAGRGTSGMFTPVSHMRGAPVVNPPNPGESVVKWAFTDDEGHRWTGLCTVEPDVRESDHALVTFELARERGRGRVHG